LPKRKPSLFSDERVCWKCGSPYAECHHIYGGNGRRSVSDREGCYVYLCHAHHMMCHEHRRDESGEDLMERLRRECQRRWMEREGADEGDFIRTFGMSYL